MTEAHPMTSIDKLERERASEILLKHLSKQGFGGSTVESGYFARRDQLTIDAMLEFAASSQAPADVVERVAMTSIDKLEPCPFCGSVPTPLSDSRVSSNCDPACPCADMSCLTQRWNTRSLTPQAGEGVVERLAYKVANAKLGEGPAVRCEGPTDYEIDIAREWVRRVLAALPPAGRVEELELALALIADETTWRGFSPAPIVERMRETARTALNGSGQ